MHPQWARDLRDQCTAASVPYFFKQWGEWALHDGVVEFDPQRFDNQLHLLENGVCWKGYGARMCRVGKKAAGRVLGGRTWDEMPERVS